MICVSLSLQPLKGHLLETETYIGGHVECLQSGVFRSDLKLKFNLEPEAYQMVRKLFVEEVAAAAFMMILKLEKRTSLYISFLWSLVQLIDQLDDALRFAIVVEGKLSLNDVTNYGQVWDK